MYKTKIDFQNWLRKKGLAESSIDKYVKQAHNRILKDLGISFYEIQSIEELSQLLMDVKELEKRMEKDPKRMYSSAVSNFIKFTAEKIDSINTFEDSNYEYSVEESVLTLATLPKVNSKPKPRAKLVEGSTIRYERKAKVGAEAILLADFKCEINSNHRSFISRRTKKNYVEAHHLIPIAYQGVFEYGIDEVENIASLCPVCHKCIHLGENNQRSKLIIQLHESFKPELDKIGIEISRKELLELYNVE